MARRLGQRTRLSPSRYPAVNEARVSRQRCLWAKAQTLHCAWPKSFDQCIGFADEIGGEREPVRMFQVNRH
jgi:hypothetical protein